MKKIISALFIISLILLNFSLCLGTQENKEHKEDLTYKTLIKNHNQIGKKPLYSAKKGTIKTILLK